MNTAHQLNNVMENNHLFKDDLDHQFHKHRALHESFRKWRL